MATWSENGRALGLASCVCAFALACTLNPLAGDPSATAAGVPPTMAQGFAEIVKKVTPAVVNIAVTGGSEGARGRRPLPPGPFGGPPGGPPGDEPGGELPTPPPMPPPGPHGRPDQSAGSGVILDSNGYIVTNNHVVEGATQITVTLSDRREFSAKIIGTDPKTDLAVVKIEAKDLPPVKWAEYEKLQVGDLVLAIGSPFGLSSTVTLGIISALGRGNVGIADYEDFSQTDAAINPGNSGGALVNMNGDLIGINTAIFSRTGGSEGIGFAIPSTIAMDVTDALMKRGDVIIGFDDREVKNVSQLRNMVARTIVGRQAKLKVLREGKEQFLNVKVGERPTDEMLAKKEPSAPQTPQDSVKPPDNVLASLRVQTLDAATMSQLNLPGKTSGVLINHVEPGSPAEAAGLQRGDVIQEVNHEVIKSLDDYQKMSAKIKKDEMAVLLLSRQGNNLFVAVNPK